MFKLELYITLCVRVFVCVCVDCICALLRVVIYVIVSMCVRMMIHELHGRFEVVS